MSTLSKLAHQSCQTSSLRSVKSASRFQENTVKLSGFQAKTSEFRHPRHPPGACYQNVRFYVVFTSKTSGFQAKTSVFTSKTSVFTSKKSATSFTSLPCIQTVRITSFSRPKRPFLCHFRPVFKLSGIPRCMLSKFTSESSSVAVKTSEYSCQVAVKTSVRIVHCPDRDLAAVRILILQTLSVPEDRPRSTLSSRSSPIFICL